MGNIDKIAKIYSKDKFNVQLNDLADRFNVKAKFILPREWVVNELNARKIKEQKKEKLKHLPLIGKMISRTIPTNSNKRSSESEFILELMDKLGLECLTTDLLSEILKNREEVYEKHFKTDYENEIRVKLENYIMQLSQDRG